MPVRKVVNRRGSVIGKFPSLKMQRQIAFESLLERDFVYILDYDTAVSWFEEQPLTIEYAYEGKTLHYTPDFHLIEHGQDVLVECKPEHFVNTTANSRKFAVAQAWCQGCNWQFRVVTDHEVRAGYRLRNIKLLTASARQRLDPVLRCQLYALLQSIPVATPIQDLACALRGSDPVAVTAGLLHLAYHGVVELPLDCAPITRSTAVTLHRQTLAEGAA